MAVVLLPWQREDEDLSLACFLDVSTLCLYALWPLDARSIHDHDHYDFVRLPCEMCALSLS